MAIQYAAPSVLNYFPMLRQQYFVRDAGKSAGLAAWRDACRS
jgi:hypothetical protein